MAAVGTKFYVELIGSESGKKSIPVSNPQDSITMAEVNAFVSSYDALYPTETFALSTCYYQDVENRGLNA